jgi:hypothetical protein
VQMSMAAAWGASWIRLWGWEERAGKIGRASAGRGSKRHGRVSGGRTRGGRTARGREADSHERRKVLTSFCLHFVLFSSRDSQVTIH